MATKKAAKKVAKKTPPTTPAPANKRKNGVEVDQKQYGEPAFPYTNRPGSLRKFLQLIPSKPKPPKVEKNLMRSWGLTDTNDMSILRVLRAIGLLNPANEPTPLYMTFMSLNGGAASLATPIRSIYAPLFAASHAPYKETQEVLKSLFNIHSGGSPSTLDYQVQTFKALSESTTFDKIEGAVPQGAGADAGEPVANFQDANKPMQPTIHIDLHIHLPENKSRRDYESMIEEIGRSIYGRSTERQSDE